MTADPGGHTIRSMDEAELIQRCRRGERDAYKALYERFVERIYRFLLRMTRNPDDAFDLCQTSFVRAFEHLTRFDGRSSLATWLHRIAVNEALQLLRRRRTEARHVAQLATASLATTAPSPEARVDLEDALAGLSDEHRAILILRYQQGLSYREIAAVLNVAEGTIASRLNRARELLRAALDPAAAREGRTTL